MAEEMVDGVVCVRYAQKQDTRGIFSNMTVVFLSSCLLKDQPSLSGANGDRGTSGF
jgi:hypothetical protein